MNGEYCSHQQNILSERERLHREGKINAFVIMNFSDMSDVVYKWRLNDFIKSLKNYLYINLDTQELICCANKNIRDTKLEVEKKNGGQGSNVKKVEHIQIVRSDSEFATNYVICSRICQQLLIADLVIVDVSLQNPNVFYEFGMSVALGKMILPICYSESFYKRVIPEGLKEELKKKDVPNSINEVSHHMGCFPWRKNLFEYYGLRYKGKEVKTKYIKFIEATNKQYGFSDIQYNRFPYNTPASMQKEGKRSIKINSKEVGRRLYEKLMRQYNEKGEGSNTLVVYTMEGILNEEQVGQCIINYYEDIVSRIQEGRCFCGDRVGVLVQGNQIPEKDKDVSDNYNLLYSMAEITRIGVNQATYKVNEEKITAKDEFKANELEEEIKKLETRNENQGQDFVEVHKREIGHFIKNHVGNRGLLVYPDNPIYVERIKNGMYGDFLEDEEGRLVIVCEKEKRAFCFFHVMVKTLEYTNQVVVDISNNSIQALFWLGTAHGMEVHAVTVLHEASEYEQNLGVKRSRNLFDVAGLWTAIHYTHDTEGFYKQLILVQKGIEQHSRLVLRNTESLEKYLKRKCKEEKREEQETDVRQWKENKSKQERLMLESYYRNWFWKIMLQYNRLRIYLPQRDEMKCDEPFLRVAKWDMDAVSSLTHYLSKRSVIGEYKVITLPEKCEDKEVGSVNFISLGNPVNPMGKSLPEYINESCLQRGKSIKIHICKKQDDTEEIIPLFDCEESYVQKGFEQIGSKDEAILTQHPRGRCTRRCPEKKIQKSFSDRKDILKENLKECTFKNKGIHEEVAQLILWRELQKKTEEGEYRFRVGVTGSSGPATYALSSLFVDEDNKLCDFLQQKNNTNREEIQPLLYDLQREIRDTVVEQYLRRLDANIDQLFSKVEEKELGQYQCYKALVKYALTKYLSTVLYRYFFPFLTQKDIQRIHNGLYMFVHSMKAAKVSPFVLEYSAKRNSNFKTAVQTEVVEAIIETIPSTLVEVLREFEGVEAFYKVKVWHRSFEEGEVKSTTTEIRDVRKVKAIEAYKEVKDGKHKINYWGF